MKISVKVKDVEIVVDDSAEKTITHTPYNEEVKKLIIVMSQECVKLYNLRKTE
jgi:predicted site-specific integrase-resolvase